MGTSVILDILGSMIIGGILLLTLFRMNDNATRNTYNFTGELGVQQNLITTVKFWNMISEKLVIAKNRIAL